MLVGQRVRLQGRRGEVPGVIGKKPIHLMKAEERDKVSKITDLWIDVGADGRKEVVSMGLRVGDPAVLDARIQILFVFANDDQVQMQVRRSNRSRVADSRATRTRTPG